MILLVVIIRTFAEFSLSAIVMFFVYHFAITINVKDALYNIAKYTYALIFGLSNYNLMNANTVIYSMGISFILYIIAGLIYIKQEY